MTIPPFSWVFLTKLPKTALQPQFLLSLVKKKASFSEQHQAVNEYRAYLKGPLLPRIQKKEILNDYEKCLKALCFKIAAQIFEQKKGKSLLLTYKKIITSPVFLERSQKYLWLDEVADRILGLNEWKVKSLYRRNLLKKPSLQLEDLYLENEPEYLFTPYRAILEIVKAFPRKKIKVVDLGSGLGRFLFALRAIKPKLDLVGIEVLPERFQQSVAAQQKLQIKKNFLLLPHNLHDSTVPFPEGDFYFLFNPFSRRTLLSVFNSLRKVSLHKKIQIGVVKTGRTHAFFKKNSVFKKVKSKTITHWEGYGFEVYRS